MIYDSVPPPEPPYRKVGKRACAWAMARILQEWKIRPKTGVVWGDWPLIGEFERSKGLTDASEHYHEVARWGCAHFGWRGPSDAWSDTDLRADVIRRGRGIPTLVRRLLLEKSYSAAHFDPAVAAAVIRYACATSVMDPCLGWGDRLAASLAVSPVQNFWGCDPNSVTAPGYAAQIRDWARGRDFTAVLGAFEDQNPPSGFDLVLTSPPYWKTEMYSADPAQSFSRYKTYEAWDEGFLQALVEKSVRSLRPGGLLAINIMNVVLDRKLIPLIPSTMKWAAMQPLERVGVFTIPFQSRCRIEKSEPLFLWRKHGRQI